MQDLGYYIGAPGLSSGFMGFDQQITLENGDEPHDRSRSNPCASAGPTAPGPIPSGRSGRRAKIDASWGADAWSGSRSRMSPAAASTGTVGASSAKARASPKSVRFNPAACGQRRGSQGRRRPADERDPAWEARASLLSETRPDAGPFRWRGRRRFDVIREGETPATALPRLRVARQSGRLDGISITALNAGGAGRSRSDCVGLCANRPARAERRVRAPPSARAAHSSGR